MRKLFFLMEFWSVNKMSKFDRRKENDAWDVRRAQDLSYEIYLSYKVTSKTEFTLHFYLEYYYVIIIYFKKFYVITS